MALSTGLARLFAASMRGVHRSRLARARTVPSGMPMFAGDLAQSDAGSEGGFDLLPRFDGNLAAHVRLNLTGRRAIAKFKMLLGAIPADPFDRVAGEKIFKFLRNFASRFP